MPASEAGYPRQDLLERLEKDQIQLMGIISSLKAQRDFECLKGEPEYFVGLSEASDELKAVN